MVTSQESTCLETHHLHLLLVTGRVHGRHRAVELAYIFGIRTHGLPSLDVSLELQSPLSVGLEDLMRGEAPQLKARIVKLVDHIQQHGTSRGEIPPLQPSAQSDHMNKCPSEVTLDEKTSCKSLRLDVHGVSHFVLVFARILLHSGLSDGLQHQRSES